MLAVVVVTDSVVMGSFFVYPFHSALVYLSDDELEQVVAAAVAAGQDAGLTAAELRSRLPEPAAEYAYSADERATGVLSVAVAVPNRTGRRPSESISLTSPVEAASEATLKAGVPELRRAASRLSELLEGSVY